jgi:hypothetical protein
MRKSFGVTDGLYFTDGKTKAEEENELERDRASNRGVEFKKQVMLDDSNVLLSTYNKTNSGLAYGHIVKATNSYKPANAAMVNAMKMASTKEDAQAIRDAVIIGQNGKTTTWGERYSQLADEAERYRVERIASNSNTARLNKERAINDFTLKSYQNGDFDEGFAKNPHAQWEDITKGYADEGMVPPQYLKNEYSNATTKYNEQQIAEYETSQAEVPDALINAAKGTHQTALKALKEKAELRKFGGQLGKDALAAQAVTAKGIYKLSVEGPGSANSELLEGVLKAKWKDIWKEKGFGFATDPETIGGQVAIVNKELQTKLENDKNDSTARFYIPDVAKRNDVVLPNLFPDYKDYQQRKTLVDQKFVDEQSVGEITSTPSLLAKPSELAALSRKSETSTDLNYPPLVMYVAAETKRAPSEIANAQIEANNFNYGTKTPLITPNIKSKAIDEASKYSYNFAKEMASDNKIISDRGTANYTQQLSTPGQGPLDLHRRLVYRTGNIGPTSTGEHLDVKQVGGGRFEPSDLDQYVRIQDPEYGDITLSELGRRLPGRGDNFDQHMARGSHGIDFPTASGTQVYLTNGAKEISNTPTEHGNYLVFETPSGKRYSFLHGKAASQ